MTDQDPDSATEPTVDDKPRASWLTAAIVAQALAVLWNIIPSTDSGASAITASIFNLGLLLLLQRGQGWARKAFLTLTIVGLAMRGLIAFALQYFPKAEYDINWVNMCLGAFAVYAVLKLPAPPRAAPPVAAA